MNNKKAQSPLELKAPLDHKGPFKDYYQEFVYKSRYARWREEDNRRENWDETVARYINFFKNQIEIIDD